MPNTDDQVAELLGLLDPPLRALRELRAGEGLTHYDRAELAAAEEYVLRAVALVQDLEERLTRVPESHGARRAAGQRVLGCRVVDGIEELLQREEDGMEQ